MMNGYTRVRVFNVAGAQTDEVVEATAEQYADRELTVRLAAFLPASADRMAGLWWSPMPREAE